MYAEQQAAAGRELARMTAGRMLQPPVDGANRPTPVEPDLQGICKSFAERLAIAHEMMSRIEQAFDRLGHPRPLDENSALRDPRADKTVAANVVSELHASLEALAQLTRRIDQHLSNMNATV